MTHRTLRGYAVRPNYSLRPDCGVEVNRRRQWLQTNTGCHAQVVAGQGSRGQRLGRLLRDSAGSNPSM
jgi:hypothetical protein